MNCIKHFKTITKHKFYVFKACCELGIPWRGIIHDFSKFTPVEFYSSVKFFQGNRSPIEAEKDARGYSLAWQNHKGRNRHHWHYWLDVKDGEIKPIRMPRTDVLELIADWVGAGKAYNPSKWTQAEPLNYWQKEKHKVIIHEDTRYFLELSFEFICEYGWKNYTTAIKLGVFDYLI